jgi:dipeptidyl aminopeptidase/acylaminoacyl peptidase
MARVLCFGLLLALLLGCGANAPSTASPPAGRFTLVLRPSDAGDLAVGTLDGGPGRPIASGVNNPACPAGGGLFYTAVTSGSNQLVRFDLAADTAQVLVDDPAASLTQAECVAGSDRLLYARTPAELVDGEPAPPAIWRTDLAGAAPAPFHPDPALNQRWSPDGRAVAFELADAPNLMLLDPAGTLRRLDYTGTFDWSPDSKYLVVSQLGDSANGRFPRLVRYEVASGQTTTLFEDSQADVYFPRWSPDGRQIAFIRRPLGAEHGEIWVLPVNQPSAGRQISSDPSYDNFDPQWSADSQALLWSRALPASNRFSVWYQRLDASAPTLVADDALWPRWINE